MPIPRASAALTRFTVLDLTRVRAGPTAVRQLADWGANVIKVELPEHQEPADAMGGPRHGPDFQNLHRNKRAITLDLKSKDGAAVFRRLAAKADVIVENFRPDVKARLGIDYATLAKLNPRLVYASISGFGQDGPYAKRPGFDQIAPGPGRPHVDHGRAGTRTDAGRHSHRRPLGRPLLRARHPGGAAGTRAVGQGPGGRHLAAAGADLHARLPGLALAQRPGGAGPGRQQSSNQHPDRRVQDARRPHQYRHRRNDDVGAAVPRHRRRKAHAEARVCDLRRPPPESRRPQRRDRELSGRRHQRRVGRAHQCRRGAVRADLCHRPDLLPTRK